MQKQPKHYHLTHTDVYVATAILLSCLVACHRTEPEPENQPVTDVCATGIYILNEGLFQMNNSSISYYDFATGDFIEDVFLTRNGRGLGDGGNDLKKYGSKLYCVVTNSNRLEIMNLEDATSLKSIPLDGKQPRKIAFHSGKAYISCFDGTVLRLDTATLEIDGTMSVGSNPEGLCIANHKLYVANSGGLNYPNYGHTVSVVDLSTFSVLKNIDVVKNPAVLLSDDEGDVYLACLGNYIDIPYTFQKIDSHTDEVVNTFEWPVLNFAIQGDFAYLYSYDFIDHTSWVKVMDITTDKIVRDNFVTDSTVIQTPHSIDVNPLNGDVYISDAYNSTVNGDVYCFNREGKKKFSRAAGLNPNCIVFKY